MLSRFIHVEIKSISVYFHVDISQAANYFTFGTHLLDLNLYMCLQCATTALFLIFYHNINKKGQDR